MSKRIRLFLVAIAAVLVGSTVLFLVVNNSFISPYYVHQQRKALREVCLELSSNTDSPQSYIEYAEASKGVIIVMVPDTGDISQMNEQLREAFLSKGLGLAKYWLWEEDYKSTLQNGTQQRVYGQGNLGYNLLVQYLIQDDQLVAVATVIPHLSRPLALANTISAVIMGGTALLLMALVWWMSTSLERAQNKLSAKNQQMKQLLNHVSHDLKTPIALIKAYTAGMKDGMDDGSFLDTIAQQNERMEQLTLRLLTLSKYEDATPPLDIIDISDLVSKELKRQLPLFTAQELSIVRNIQPGLSVKSSGDAFATIIENLLSNAAKYATGSPVMVSLYREDAHIVMEVKNLTDLPSDTKTELLWDPFSVAEGSRNSMLSGSGLGLSLVRAAAKSVGASSQCSITDGQFCMKITVKSGR